MRWIVPVLSLACTALAQTPMDIQPVKQLVRGKLAGYLRLHPARTGGALSQEPACQGADHRLVHAPIHYFRQEGEDGELVRSPPGHLGFRWASHPADRTQVLRRHDRLPHHAGLSRRRWRFQAALEADPKNLPALSLVRVYGTVKEETGKIPLVAVDYLRVWPWFTFTFTDLGAEDLTTRAGSSTATYVSTATFTSPIRTKTTISVCSAIPRSLGLR